MKVQILILVAYAVYVFGICTVDEEKSIIDQIRTKLFLVEQLSQNRGESCNEEQSTASIQGPNTQLVQSHGTIFVRWGNVECPGNGTELLYEGFVGGSKYNRDGGASNHLCLPKEPVWGRYKAGTTGEAIINAAEYEDNSGRAREMFGKTMDDNDVPCAVCHSTQRGSQVMIPARNVCYGGWTLEYAGYLMASRVDGTSEHKRVGEYICVDEEMVTISGGSGNNEQAALLYLVEAACGGSMTCPPYVDGREITCAVCTK